jgi:hypothetical protein
VKLAVTQTVLGLIITVFACIITGWMIFGAPSLLTMPVPDEGGANVMTTVVPQHEALFTAARYVSGLLLALGLAVLSLSFLQRPLAEGHRTGLAAVQMIFGVLIAAAAVFVSRWGYPLVFIIPMPESSNITGRVNILPAPQMTGVIFLTGISTLLGAGVLGVGIAQLVKSRREKI